MPSPHDAGLDVAEDQQGDGHDADAAVQGDGDAVGHEVRDQRDEAADEVAQGQGQRGDPRLVAVGRRLLVVEGDEEVAQVGRRSVQRAVDLADGGLGDAVRCEDRVNNGRRFGGGGADEGVGFADGGFV